MSEVAYTFYISVTYQSIKVNSSSVCVCTYNYCVMIHDGRVQPTSRWEQDTINEDMLGW